MSYAITSMPNSTGKSGPSLSVSRVDWFPCYRATPGQTDDERLFARLADPSGLEELAKIEALTNPLSRFRSGSVRLLPEAVRADEDLAFVAQLPLILVRDSRSRFDDEACGVWYGGSSIVTAVAESIPYRERFLAATNEAPGDIQLTVYAATLVSNLHDLRGRRHEFPELFNADDRGPAQELVSNLRHIDSQGIAYESNCDPGGECVALFRTDILRNIRLIGQFRGLWDGHRIVRVLGPGQEGNEDEWVQIWP